MTLGKVIGGGLPLAAVGGRAVFMDRFAPDGPVYQAGTLAGNPLAVAAGLKTLEMLERDNPYRAMADVCAALADGVNGSARRRGVPVRAARFGGVFTLFCSADPVTDLATAQRCDTPLYARIFHCCTIAASISPRRNSSATSSPPPTPPMTPSALSPRSMVRSPRLGGRRETHR